MYEQCQLNSLSRRIQLDGRPPAHCTKSALRYRLTPPAQHRPVRILYVRYDYVITEKLSVGASTACC